MTKKKESPYQITLDFLIDLDRTCPEDKQLSAIEKPDLQQQKGSAQTIDLSPPVTPPFEPDLSVAEQRVLPFGTLISSPGSHFTYRVLGSCCRLFDREELPWPCCRIQWRSKEPSWRRIGKRFVPDLATKRSPSYVVEILDQEYAKAPFVLTLYWVQLPPEVQQWWYRRYVPSSSLQLSQRERLREDEMINTSVG